jgi:hypothetical protein
VTVSTTSNAITYTGNNATTVWTFPFPGVAASDIVVQTVTGGVTTTISPALYTVSLNAPVAPNPTGIGGSVTYPLSGSPLAPTTNITILRTLPVQQNTSLANQGTLYQTVIEQALDYITMLVQQILGPSSVNTLAITAPPTDPAGLNYILPAVAQRSGQNVTFDASGNVTVGAPSAAPVSAAMQPVVNSATLAAARTALQLGTMATEGIGAGLQDDGSNNARVTFPWNTVSTPQTVDKTYHDQRYAMGGNVTWTLPRANTLFSGFRFVVYTGSGTATFAPNAADVFVGSATGSWVVSPGCLVALSTDAAASGNWYPEVLTPFVTYTIFTTGVSQTYNTKPGCRRLRIRMVGGGGSGGGTSGGVQGSESIFGTVHAAPGNGGSANSGASGGAGGTGGTGGAGTATLRIPGQDGDDASDSNATHVAGTRGGSSAFFGGGAAASFSLSVGKNPKSNTGGGGNSFAAGGGSGGGGGGGAGEYVELDINNPATSYVYTVAAATAAPSNGTAGAGGQIIIEEHY